MSYISIETDLNDAMELLEGLYKNSDKMRASLLGQIGTKAKNKAKKSYRNVLHKRSGYLYKSIRRYMYRNKKAVVITAHNKDDKVRYGFVLAHGTTIEAKNSEYLTFQVEGKWVRKHSVRIEARDFIEGPVDRYLASREFDTDKEKIVQKQIDKIEQKKKVTENGK